MQTATTYEVQEHDGLKWYTVTTKRDEASAKTELDVQARTFKDKPHRVIERPSRRVVVLHDPRSGDMLGPIKALPVEPVHTRQEAAAIAMLGALKLAKRRLEGEFMLSTAMTIATVNAAIANAEAAGIRVEG